MFDNDKQLQILPNSSLILALGVLSIFFICFVGIVSLILGIITLILANQANQLYKETPRAYTPKSIQNVNTGKTCAIIGLMLSALTLLIMVIAILFGAAMAFSFLPFCL